MPAEIVTFLPRIEVTPIILSQLHLSLYSIAKASAASEDIRHPIDGLMVKRLLHPLKRYMKHQIVAHVTLNLK